LEGLLKDYDKNERPAFKQGKIYFYIIRRTITAKRDKNKVNKKYENKIQVLTTTFFGKQQQQDGDEIPPPLLRKSKYHTFVKK
jgi:hypothetical protein